MRRKGMGKSKRGVSLGAWHVRRWRGRIGKKHSREVVRRVAESAAEVSIVETEEMEAQGVAYGREGSGEA